MQACTFNGLHAIDINFKASASQHILSAYIQSLVRNSHAASVGTCSVYDFLLVGC